MWKILLRSFHYFGTFRFPQLITEPNEEGCNIDAASKQKEIGRRITDMSHVFKSIIGVRHPGGFGCCFVDNEFVREQIDGFFSKWIFKCKMCNLRTVLSSEEVDRCVMPINDATVHGIVAGGGGYSQLAEFSAAIGVHCMSNSTFSKHLKTVKKAVMDAALLSMLDAAKEEREHSIAVGDVGPDGVPLVTVVADGQWCKRSYKTKYDSLSGVVRAYSQNGITISNLNKYLL
jgi:hypothetical protein